MQSYTPELKAQILADLAMGTPIKTVVRKYKVPEGTIRYWRNTTDVAPALKPEKRDDLGLLVYEYLTTGLQALIAQARVVATPEYIQAQPADALYLLHGTLADKLIALFGAIERGRSDTSAEFAEDGETIPG